MKSFIELPKLSPGDQVGIISPSSGLPGLFPWVQDLGLERLRNVFNLVHVEYPTTRQMGSSLKDRARDIEAAFTDPKNKAVISSIGGDDQIKLIKYLNPQVFLDNVKPFFGYSDNTHLCNFLWNLGIPSYYGGAIMTQFAMQGKMDAITTDSLKLALFEKRNVEIAIAENYTEEDLDWSVKENLNKTRKQEKNDGLFWDGSIDVEGTLWGGCAESLVVQMTSSIYLPSDEELENTLLFIETAEDIPDHWIVEYLLTGFGERGWFDKFRGVLVGRPKTWAFDKPFDNEQKAAYRKKQRETVMRVVREYNSQIPIVQNLDFGHTDPQIAVPMGGKAKILSQNRKVVLSY